MKSNMKYGEKYETFLVDTFTKKRVSPYIATCRYVEYGGYHTNNEGEGIWLGNKQIIGTCDFSVAGCKTEKAAKAKIKKWVTEYNSIL